MKHLRWRWLKVGVVTLAAGALLGGGMAAFWAWGGGAARRLQAGEEAVQAGTAALEKEPAAAALRFQEAQLLADNLLEQVGQQRQDLKEPTPEKVAALAAAEGQAYWLKARAARGLGLAKLAAEGKPIYTRDGADDRNILDLTRIADEKLRREAVVSLREAALRLAAVDEVQREALRVEVQGDPARWNWPLASTFAQQLLQLDPRDARAHFVLARFDCDQPGTGGGQAVASPPAKRSRERMLKAREHVAALKQGEKPPRYRTLHLEAQITLWLAESYRQAANPKPDLEKRERERLQALLFDDGGALRRAEQDERLPRLSRLDADGVLALHLLALETAATRKPAGGEGAPAAAGEAVAQVFGALLDVGRKMTAEADTAPARIGEVAEVLAQAAQRAQPYLALDRAGEAWPRSLDAIAALAQRAADKDAGNPGLYLALADLLGKEAELAGRQGQSSAQVRRRLEAIHWAEVGLKIGQARKLPAAQLLALHDQAARLKALGGARREDLAGHLKALREGGTPQGKAAAYLLEGTLAERDGRLEKAQELLEKAAQCSAGSVGVRAHVVLVNVYLALGLPEKALASLREVDKMYERLDRLPDEEKAFVQEFIRGPQELALLNVQARLGTARKLVQTRNAELARNPKSRNPEGDAQLVKTVLALEEEAQKRLATLPPRSPAECAARQALAAFLAATDRPTRAQQELNALRRDFPDNPAVLRLDVRFAVQAARPAERPAAVTAADKKIQAFLAEYPTTPAKMLWAEWLVATGRAPQAASYLEDPANFPDGRDSKAYQRLLATAFLKMGERDKVVGALQALPADPARDAALIVVAASAQEREKQVHDALARHERNGLFRCWNAGLAYSRRDYAEAARGFLGAVEFTHVRTTAQQGLRTSLLAMAQEDPAKARDLCAELLQANSAEPNLLLPYAYACLLLDDLGNPAETPDRIKDMSSALHALEAALAKDGQDPAAGPIFKANLWMMANRPDRARPEVIRALGLSPRHEGALTLAVRLALDSSDPTALASGYQYLTTLQEVRPQAPVVAVFRARLLEREGKPAEAIRVLEDVLTQQPRAEEAYQALTALLFRQADAAARDKLATWIPRWRKELPDSLAGVKSQVRWTAGARAEEADQAARDLCKRLEEKAADRIPAKPRADVTIRLAKAEDETTPAGPSPRTLLCLATAEGFTQAQAWDRAREWLDRALTEQPESEAARLQLGELYLQRLTSEEGKKAAAEQRRAWAEEAKRAYVVVYQRRKGHLVAGNNLAWLLAHELNDPEEAWRITKEVRTGRHSSRPLPGDRLPAELLDTIGQVFAALNKPELAGEVRDLFEAAKQRYPNDPRMFLHLGHAYVALRQPRKAEQCFAAAIALAGPAGKTGPLAPPQRARVVEEARAAQQKLAAGG